jgi:flagellar L-ring protein precursor FlgH
VQRAGRVAAQLTVTVKSVAPNQELFVSGRQQILVNGEKQLIELSGRVRPIDISESNTVVSSRIADAHITYVGDGILAEKQKQGILSHILGWLGLL